MLNCKELCFSSPLGDIYEEHFAAKKGMDYLDLAIKMEELRPTDEDGAKLKELKTKHEDAIKAYHATFTPMFEEKKRLRGIVHAWPEYLALSQAFKEAREAYYKVSDEYNDKKEAHEKAHYEFKQREKYASVEFSIPMWTYTGQQELNKLSAERDALAKKKETTEEALKAYEESIKYHYIASGLLERMNDFE